MITSRIMSAIFNCRLSLIRNIKKYSGAFLSFYPKKWRKRERERERRRETFEIKKKGSISNSIHQCERAANWSIRWGEETNLAESRGSVGEVRVITQLTTGNLHQINKIFMAGAVWSFAKKNDWQAAERGNAGKNAHRLTSDPFISEI